MRQQTQTDDQSDQNKNMAIIIYILGCFSMWRSCTENALFPYKQKICIQAIRPLLIGESVCSLIIGATYIRQLEAPPGQDMGYNLNNIKTT